MKNMVAVIACISVLFLYAVAGALMNWQHAGGLIGQLFLWLVLMPATWFWVRSLFSDKAEKQKDSTSGSNKASPFYSTNIKVGEDKPPINENDLYAKAWSECNENIAQRNTGLWAKAYSEADGDEKKAAARYIQARKAQLEEEERLLQKPKEENNSYNAQWQTHKSKETLDREYKRLGSKWFQISTEQGGASTQNMLGWCYLEGCGVVKDYKEAIEWYRKSAEQGYAEAQFNLACMYAKGQGVAQDYTEALKWCLRSAEQGDLEAQYNLGIMYTNGQGITQDYVEAYKWIYLANASKVRDIMTKSMTPDQISEGQRLAREWKPKR